MRKLLASLIAALFVIAPVLPYAASPASARTDSRAGSRFECPPGKMLAGFTGYVGLWVDSIQGICAQANEDRTFRQPVVAGPVFGGGANPNQTEYCPIGAALSGIEVSFTRNLQVAWLTLTCRTLASNRSAGQLYFGNTSYVASSSGTMGAYRRSPKRSDCPTGEMPTGFNVSATNYINDVDLICDQIAYPRPKPAPPPVVQRPSGPPTAPASAFAGGWNTVTNQSGHFTMVITQLGQPNRLVPLMEVPFSGVFTNSDGASQYDGTLRGTVNFATRIFTYEYVQPGISAAGQGKFVLSQDGESFTGSGISMGKDQFTWSGTRIP